MDFQHELNVAIEAATIAGNYARDEYEQFEAIPDAPVTITTHVDRHCQDLILTHLHKYFPNDQLVAEERTDSSNLSPDPTNRSWIVDPIDGTKGFARKTGEFSIMIGLAIEGLPMVGVVYEPIPNRLTYAALGQGCYMIECGNKPQRCSVSAQTQLSDLSLVQSRTQPGKAAKPILGLLKPTRVVETYSAGVKLAMVAHGRVDLFANDYSGFNDWDVCAGHILVEEAGGKVTLFNGEPIRYGQSRPRRGIIACNPEMLTLVLQLLSDI